LNVRLCEKVPEWLGELVHVEDMCIDGTMHSDGEAANCVLMELPPSLGNLQALKTLSLMHLAALDLACVNRAAGVARNLKYSEL